MIPGYRCMDSYPYQMNQVPLPHYYFPGFENVPPQLRMDASRYPMKHDFWPTSGNHEHFRCHDCCNHGCSGDYHGFRPPFPAGPCFNGCGNYFMYPPVHIAPPYYGPPIHLSTEQPQYEYEKYVPKNYHCCGCPNHLCSLKNDRGVNIEEQEPEVDKKKNDSPLPVQMKSYPYPIVWIPAEQMQNQQLQKPIGSELTSWKTSPSETEPPESLKPPEHEPKIWSSWVPLDINNPRPLTQDGKKEQSPQNEERTRRFPFPIFWMPSYGKQQVAEKEGGGKTNSSPNSVDEQPSNFMCLPVKLFKTDNEMDKTQKVEENSGKTVGSEMEERTINKKSIPVKELDEHKLDKPSGKSTGKRSSSPLKTSRLPPVCLRVDPLPSKENGDRSSRSPSPHTRSHKGQTSETAKDSPKAHASPSSNENIKLDEKTESDTLKQNKELEPNGKKRETNVVMGKTAEENKEEEQKIECVTQIPIRSPVNFEGEVPKDGIINGNENKKTSRQRGLIVGEAADTKESTEVEYVNGEYAEAVRRNLSDLEAAILIQSAYRGYEVRKWEPLKKLKQLVKVREQMLEVKSQVEAMEIFCDLKKDDRQRVILGEVIMNLLLKLDAIQGLHPSLRDIRKSLARELVTLQEKLDTFKKSKEEIELAAAKSTNDLSVGALSREGVENKETRVRESSYVNCYSDVDKLTGPDKDEFMRSGEGACNSHGSAVSEPVPVDREILGINKNVIHEAPVTDGVSEPGHQLAEAVLTTAPENMGGNTEPDVAQVETAVMYEGVETSMNLGQSSEVSPAEEVKTNSEENQFTEILFKESHQDNKEDDNFKENEVVEHPQNVITTGCAALELEDNMKDREQGEKIEHVKKDELDNLIDVAKDPELLELPLGVFDEDEVDEKHELLGSGANVEVWEEHLPGNKACKEEMDQSQGKEEHDVNEPLVIPGQVKSEAGKEASDKNCGGYGEGLIGSNNSTSESAAEGVNAEKKSPSEETREEREQQLQEVQFQDLEGLPVEDKIVDMLAGAETANKEVPAETCVPPVSEEQNGGERKQNSHMTTDESGMLTERDCKMIEENRQLREMMEKLLVADKEQLHVISNLTGRVKDLERKLQKKKLRMARRRKATSARPCAKPLKSLPKERL